MHLKKRIFSSQQGSLPFLAVGLVLLLTGLAFGGWYVWQRNHKTEHQQANTNQHQSDKAEQKKEAVNTRPDSYEGWQAYGNTTYGISFKYPSDWKITEAEGSEAQATSEHRITTRYAIILDLKKEFKYNETINVEILNQNLSEVANWYDGYYAQSVSSEVSKTYGDLKGKQSIQYNVQYNDGGNGEPSKLYLFSVGKKTYSFASFGSSQLDPEFWPKFDKVFDSLQISAP